jgi:hypothetical protein
MWYDSGVLNAVSIPISSNVVVPLKTINSLGCTDNNLNILGTDEVVVSGAGNNTLVIQLPVADANLNVVRSTTYV